MGNHNPIAGTSRCLLWFCVTLLAIVSSCHCEQKVHKSSSTVQVVGVVSCLDCTKANVSSTQALSGLRVTIDCKVSDHKGALFKTRGVSKLDKEGKFKVNLPSEIVKDDGELKEECFAQLHNSASSNAPCPTHQGLESSKLILKSKDQKTGNHYTFGPNGLISISHFTCKSAFFETHSKYPATPKFPRDPLYEKKGGTGSIIKGAGKIIGKGYKYFHHSPPPSPVSYYCPRGPYPYCPTWNQLRYCRRPRGC